MGDFAKSGCYNLLRLIPPMLQLDAFSMISLWSCVQMFLSLVCACLPVYRPILPSSVRLHQFFIRITSYAKNSRNKSSPPSNILGAEDGDSTKGLAAWTEASHGHGRYPLRVMTAGTPCPAKPCGIHVKKEFGVRSPDESSGGHIS